MGAFSQDSLNLDQRHAGEALSLIRDRKWFVTSVYRVAADGGNGG